MNPLLLAIPAFVSLVGATVALPAQAPPQFLLQAPAAIFQSFTLTCTADVDGDGDLDILASGFFPPGRALSLLRNDGVAGFTDVSAAQLPFGLQGLIALPFDCDGDGDVDVFFSGSPSQLASTLLRNNGSGTFTVAATLPNVGPSGCVAADLDGDGDLDLALAANPLLGGVDLVLVNNGSGGFGIGPTFGVASASVAVTDFDGDGDVDLLYPNTRRLLRNNGGLSFTDVGATQLVMPAQVSLGNVARGDLDGDGDLDFVVQSALGDVLVFDQGNTLVQVGFAPLQPSSSWVELADCDRDGDLDLLRSHPTGTISFARNDGHGGFVNDATRLPPFPIYSSSVHAADLDGDGDPEVLTCYPGSQALLLRNRHVHVDVGAALRGQNWNVELWSEPGYAAADGLGVLAVGLTRLPAPLPLPPFGTLRLDPNSALLVADSIPMSAGRRAFALAIPTAPQLVGVELNVQGLVAAATSGVRLTALGSAIIQ